jgi:tungstate transport system ATP-binding protein
MSALLEIDNLLIHREDDFKLDIPQLNIESGETLALIGPNGAGKSTLMLAIAGLLKPNKGNIRFNGTSLAEISLLQYRRKLGLVLQEPLLLNSSVFNNVATGLRFRKVAKSEVKRRANLWLERLGILSLSKRSARKLSGGESHRVSLARTFVLEPELLLLDEPFSALDAPTRTALLQDLQTLLHELHITTIFVTHDLDEALLMADKVAVLIDGKLHQTGTPQEVFSAPVDAQVAAFVGVETIVPGKVIESHEGLAVVKSNGFILEGMGNIPAGRDVFLCLRPEDVTLWAVDIAQPKSSARNRLQGKITSLQSQGVLVRVVVDCGFPLVSLITHASALLLELIPGKEVMATFKATAVHLIGR